MDNVDHLNPETLETYFGAQRITVRLAASPDCRLTVDPGEQALELWTPALGVEPDVTTLHRVRLDREGTDDGECFVLTVDATGMHYEAYTLIAAIVDDMRLGLSFARATESALEAYRDLLAPRARMSRHSQEGLIGELLVLRHLIAEIGGAPALESWLGPRAEEHDFVLDGFDAEVKTTTSEERVHVIGTATQLQRSPDRPLWLVSIQLTRGGTAANARTLAETIADVRSSLDVPLKPFLQRLLILGWRDTDADLYTDRYILRSVPTAYLVDDDFPAITQKILDTAIVRADLITTVSYRLNVTTLTAGSPPPPMSAFVEQEIS